MSLINRFQLAVGKRAGAGSKRRSEEVRKRRRGETGKRGREEVERLRRKQVRESVGQFEVGSFLCLSFLCLATKLNKGKSSNSNFTNCPGELFFDFFTFQFLFYKLHKSPESIKNIKGKGTK